MDCTICGKSFNSKKGLVNHTESVHGRTGVYRGVQSWENSRDQSGELTTGADAINYHYEVTDDMYCNESNTWDCGMCNREFRSSKHLLQHLNSGVHETKRYHCQECNGRFVSLAALTQHLESSGHSNRESRLLDVMLRDARQNTLMITNGSAYNECTLYFDGSAIPNPCEVAGCAWRLLDHRDFEMVFDGEEVYEMNGERRVTSNQAEYMGMIGGLRAAIDEGVKRLEVLGDSELVINQMRGEYDCHAVRLVPLYRQAKALERSFINVSYRWIPRSQNEECDEKARYYAAGY